MYPVFPVSTEGPTAFTGIYEAKCMFCYQSILCPRCCSRSLTALLITVATLEGEHTQFLTSHCVKMSHFSLLLCLLPVSVDDQKCLLPALAISVPRVPLLIQWE